MSKTKTVKQAYGATLTLADGRKVPPGTAVTLAEDEAKNLAEHFGVVDAITDEDEDKPRRKSPASLDRAVGAAIAQLDKAKADGKADAIAAAEAELAAAERELAEARG